MWEGPEDDSALELVDVEAEVRLLAPSLSPSTHQHVAESDNNEADTRPEHSHTNPSSCDEPHASPGHRNPVPCNLSLDAREVARELMRTHAGNMLSNGQLIPLTVCGCGLLLRVSGTNTLDAEAQSEAVGYHCFRGRLSPDTVVRHL